MEDVKVQGTVKKDAASEKILANFAFSHVMSCKETM